MDGRRDLYIGEVVHKAYVSVNEAGTEAAAATVIVITPTSAINEKRAEFRADHPFLFFIIEKQTGTVLFMGKLADPTA